MLVLNRTFGIILIIVAIVILIYFIVVNFKPIENYDENYQLNSEELVSLFKRVPHDLNTSSNLEINSISEISMIKFAVSYMMVSEEYVKYITYIENEYGSVVAIDKKHISSIIEYIFGKSNINFNEIDLDIRGDIVYIPTNLQGGDSDMYRYKKTEYIQEEDTYVAYIECLPSEGTLNLEQLPNYSEEYVMMTMIFKYKLVEGRRILLAYNYESKYDV